MQISKHHKSLSFFTENQIKSSLLLTFRIRTRIKLNVTEGDCSFMFESQPLLLVRVWLISSAVILWNESSIRWTGFCGYLCYPALNCTFDSPIWKPSMALAFLHPPNQKTTTRQVYTMIAKSNVRRLFRSLSSKQSINPKTALACMNCSIHVRVYNTKVFTNSARRTGNVEYFTLATLTFFAGYLCTFISPVFRADVRIGNFLNAKWFLSETFVRKGRRNARYTCRRWWMVNGGFLWSESRGWLPGYVIVTRT